MISAAVKPANKPGEVDMVGEAKEIEQGVMSSTWRLYPWQMAAQARF